MHSGVVSNDQGKNKKSEGAEIGIELISVIFDCDVLRVCAKLNFECLFKICFNASATWVLVIKFPPA